MYLQYLGYIKVFIEFNTEKAIVLVVMTIPQTLLQISVFADEPRTKIQPYTGPTVTHSANGSVTTPNKNISEDHTPNVYLEKKNVYSPIVKCKSGTYPAWYNGYQKCNNKKTGYNECVRGKIVFTKCADNQSCVAINNKKAKCTAPYEQQKCDIIGIQRCNNKKTGYNECIRGKNVFTKCAAGESCVSNDSRVAKCTAPYEQQQCDIIGIQTCNNEKTGYNECVAGKFVFTKCVDNQSCVAISATEAKCNAAIDQQQCDIIGIQRCNNEKTGYNECIRGKNVFTKCAAGESC
ncbi:hypothetical protein BB561_005920, partial [Smittium simulii]